MSNLKEFLHDLGYEVVVQKMSEGACVVYPANLVNIYSINEDGFLFSDENLQEKFIYLSLYAIRIGIALHIAHRCSLIGYSPELIKYMVGPWEVESIEHIIPLLGSPDREEVLVNIISDGLENQFSLKHRKWAQSELVLDDYETIIGFLEDT